MVIMFGVSNHSTLGHKKQSLKRTVKLDCITNCGPETAPMTYLVEKVIFKQMFCYTYLVLPK
jgi:hypothetical protein